MSKEDILDKHVSDFKSLITKGNITCIGVPYGSALSAMQEYADQEKEKVAVAFAEWKDENTTKDENGCFVIWYRNADTFSYNYSDLYQYFINNVYNK